MSKAFPTAKIGLADVTGCTARELAEHVSRSVAKNSGGWIVTANIHYLHQLNRDKELAGLISTADFIVADGVPLLWASRLIGKPLPERVTGSDLTHALASEFAPRNGRLGLIGGAGDAARDCGRTLESLYPGVHAFAIHSSSVSNPPSASEIDDLRELVADANPDLVLVGLGVPKQDYLIQALKKEFPRVWWVGVGVTLSFISGTVSRAPAWIQRAGLEWVYRLLQEPTRLWRRYLVGDLPFAIGLYAQILASRITGRH